MKRLRDPRWFLIVAFLAVIGVVPLVQLAREVAQGDGPKVLEVFEQAPTAANLRAFETSLESVNWAARSTRPWIQYSQFSWLRDGGAKAVLGRDGWYFYKPGLLAMQTGARGHGAGASGGSTNDPVAAIVDFRDQLAARGIRLLLVPVPNKESVYPDRVTTRAGAARSVLAPRTREVLEQLRAAQVEVVDLFAAFDEARSRAGAGDPPLYLAQDTHWSPEGLELAASTVARRLTELGWARPGAIEYGTKPAPVRRLGDIVRMLQAPPIERAVAPENVPCEQVVRGPAHEAYRDAADAEVLVLGDSFSRIFQEADPGAAGFVAHLARALRQPVLSLVNDGGGSTLVRQELRARPVFLDKKKVVVWEFVERDLVLGVQGWRRVALPAPSAGGAGSGR